MSAARRSSRQAALQVLYAAELGGRAEPGLSLARATTAFGAVGSHFELPEGARAFAKELVTGVAEHREEIDARIAASSTHWRIERMATVDRNVLRLAIWEMIWGATPPSVAIDEAIELARRFGGERSPAFVNGVLDAVSRNFALAVEEVAADPNAIREPEPGSASESDPGLEPGPEEAGS
jgi:N utilization substance protein B